jgi:hypothetical protein
MELADLVVINKADIDPHAATRAQAQITSSLRLLGFHGNPERDPHDGQQWQPQVLQISALQHQGMDAFPRPPPGASAAAQLAARRSGRTYCGWYCSKKSARSPIRASASSY